MFQISSANTPPPPPKAAAATTTITTNATTTNVTATKVRRTLHYQNRNIFLSLHTLWLFFVVVLYLLSNHFFTNAQSTSALSTLFLYLPLNDTAGSSTAIDYSGNGYSATSVNGVTFNGDMAYFISRASQYLALSSRLLPQNSEPFHRVLLLGGMGVPEFCGH